MRRLIAPLLASLALAAAGCGAEEGAPKRSLDPLDESLRFFPAEAEAVALLEPEGESFATLNRVSRTISSASGPVPTLAAPLRALGPAAKIADLPAGGQAGARVVVGAADADALLAGQALAVFATDGPTEMANLFDRAAGRGDIAPAGQFHEARLFRAPGGALAERDGVMLAAPSVGSIREALELRDGDPDLHLDDREAEDALDEVRQTAPVLVYLDLEEIFKGAIAPGNEWLRGVKRAAVALRPAPAGVGLEAFVDGDGTELEGEVGDASLRVVPGARVPAGAASVDGDELRAEFLLRAP